MIIQNKPHTEQGNHITSLENLLANEMYMQLSRINSFKNGKFRKIAIITDE